ncbi:MAG: HAD-IB family phosphatase [Gemmatimonadales bacterium]
MTAAAPHPGGRRFATVVLDVDSTLAGIEGIDWLADRRGGDTAAFVRGLTADAMAGRIALDEAYARRLDRVAPTREEIRELAGAYCASVAPGARDAIERLQREGVRVVAMSGGLSEALLPLCRETSIADADVFAVSLTWDAEGGYAGFDRTSPLVTQHGKAVLLRSLGLPRPILAVGDGSTDLAMKTDGAADAFAAYVGFVERAAVVGAADNTLRSFADLVRLVT